MSVSLGQEDREPTTKLPQQNRETDLWTEFLLSFHSAKIDSFHYLHLFKAKQSFCVSGEFAQWYRVQIQRPWVQISAVLMENSKIQPCDYCSE